MLPLLTALAACGGDAGARPLILAPRGAPDGRPHGGANRGNNRPSPVEVATVSRGTLARTSTVSGILEPLRTVGVNALMSGALLSVNVEEGNYVREGQTLAQIDARELEAQVKSATAALELAESTANAPTSSGGNGSSPPWSTSVTAPPSPARRRLSSNSRLGSGTRRSARRSTVS